MKCSITINMDNSAFQNMANPQTELARILRSLAVEYCEAVLNDEIIYLQPLRDKNGKTVGSAKITPKPKDR